MSTFRLAGIRGRLFLAFGSVTAMTVAATVVAWISFGGVGDSLNRLVTDNIPTIVLAARLAEKGGVISATAPALASAESEQARERAWSTLTSNLQSMNRILSQVEAPLIDDAAKTSLHGIIDTLQANLRSLGTNVRRRFWFQDRNAELVGRLRWAHADFLDEVEPMIADARFRIDIAVEQASEANTSPDQQKILQLETRRQTALLRLNAAGNLAVGLIARAASLPDESSLNDTELFLSEVQGNINNDIDVLEALPEALSLRQSLQDVMAFASGDDDLFQLRRDELKTLSDGQKLVAANRDLVEQLQALITRRVEAGNVTSQEAARQSGISIERGKFLLLAAAGFSIVVAILVVWLYVGRNLVRRITSLDQSMRAIADGKLNTHVVTDGDDEISDMATSLRTFRDTLAETQAELVQAGKLAALGQLSAGVAHELNQPLAAIRSYAHNAHRLMEKGNADAATDTIGRISKLVDRMAGTVDHLRNLARRPSPDIETVNLSKVTNDALQLMDSRIRDAGIDVVNRLMTDAIQVRAETIRLEQVLINLIGNAIDAMEEQPVRRLVISAEESGNTVTLMLEDSGAGIAEETLEKIFEPFFTTKEQGQGVGLGLAISYNIIKDFGGSVRASSARGGPTVFRIALNRAMTDEE
ncbi:ATP-binding protein [Thalassospiraceae bacterium LMO-JJ14]|nr:ATP-binding protein [Thalassospiraceae bacterium LMO-JJ14]